MSESTVQSSSIDIGKERVGTVYAKSLLGAASKSGSADNVVEEFSALMADFIVPQPAFRGILESPRVSVEEKSAILDRTLGGRVDSVLLRFLKVVCEHDRLDCLDEILRETRRLFHEMRNVMQVHLTTATPIADHAHDAVFQSLRGRFGDQIDVEMHVDSALIGGAVVRIGDKVFDGSVRQQMKLLRSEAVAGAVEKMRNSMDQFATSG